MTYFIAEISSNHNQDIERIQSLIEKAKNLGFDAVKFQLFKIDKLFSPEILSKSREHRRRKRWELPLEFIPKIKETSIDNEIELGDDKGHAMEIIKKAENILEIEIENVS